MRTVFRSDDLPPVDRLARFDEFLVNSAHPMRVSGDEPEDFHATARSLDLAAVNVVELASSDTGILRTPQLIHSYDPELYSVVLPLRGTLALVQNERRVTVGERDVTLFSSSHPFHGRISADRGTATLLQAHLPRTLLPSPAVRQIDRLLAMRLPGQEGVVALLVEFLIHLTSDSGRYRSADLVRLGTVAIDLFVAVVAHHASVDDALPGDTSRSAQLLRIKAYINRHLHQPELSPAKIAAVHHISISHLHRLFQGHDTTVSGWIRVRRLERARRDLTDPALANVPVHRIAARWGFTDHATFTRAFRTAYNIAPRDYRHIHHRNDPEYREAQHTRQDREDAEDHEHARPQCAAVR